MLGRLDGHFNLPLDLCRQVVGVLDPDSARVGDLDEPAIDRDERGDPIARDPAGGIDDGDPVAGQPVENRGLADVGTTDDSDLRYGQSEVPSHDPNSPDSTSL
jgi:hypothetical protein